MDSRENITILGNNNLISDYENKVATYLRDKNLEYTNKISKEVTPRNTIYSRYIKRLIDIIVSLFACVLLIPLNIILGICTFLDVGSPVFYRQTRVGLNGKRFTIVKFRNMNNKTDENGKLLPPSQRITKFGRIVRKLSLDELLNFWCILKGDMSLIGPRPLPVFIYDRMSNRHKSRSMVRPGLECPRVITLDYEDTCKYQRTYENDVWYVENVSFLLDLKMTFMLIKMTFSIKNRGKQANGNGVSYFVGYDAEGHALSMNKFNNVYGKLEDI